MEVLYPRCAGLDVHSRWRERVRAHRCGSEGHDRAPGVCDYDGGSARTGGLADRGGLHARGDGGDRRVLEAGVARPRRRRVVHLVPPTRSTSGTFRAARATGTTRPGSPTCWRTGSAGQLRAAGPDPGTARPDADPQATGPRDHAAHATPAEDARSREREVDARGHRHPGRQRRAILAALIAGETDPERLADCTTGRLKADRADIIADGARPGDGAPPKILLELHLGQIDEFRAADAAWSSGRRGATPFANAVADDDPRGQ